MSELDSAAPSGLSSRLPIYFVTEGAGDKTLLAIVKGQGQAAQDHLSLWRQVTKKETFSLRLFNTDRHEAASGEWDAEVIDDPSAIPELKDHRVAATEMALRVHRIDAADKTRGPDSEDFKAKIFGHRAAANRDQAN